MSNKARLILINGPAGHGKTWLYAHLAAALAKQSIKTHQVQFKGPLIKSTAILLGLNPEFVVSNYDDFKKTQYFGLTGREWMIKIATVMRSQDDNIFVTQAVNGILEKRAGSPKIFICDDLGFENELNIPLTHPEIECLVVSINPIGNVGPGEKYPNDSRFNLCHKANVKAYDSNTALELTTNALIRRGWMK